MTTARERSTAAFAAQDSDVSSGDISAYQRLWQEVLLLGVRNAMGISLGGDNPGLNHRIAKRWIESNSRDFRMVCDLAGMDPDFVYEAYTSGRINPAVLDEWNTLKAGAA